MGDGPEGLANVIVREPWIEATQRGRQPPNKYRLLRSFAGSVEVYGRHEGPPDGLEQFHGGGFGLRVFVPARCG